MSALPPESGHWRRTAKGASGRNRAKVEATTVLHRPRNFPFLELSAGFRRVTRFAIHLRPAGCVVCLFRREGNSYRVLERAEAA